MAEAAESPSSPTVERADDSEIIFHEGGLTRRFGMRDGRLYVGEDGKGRAATPDETALCNSIQRRRKAMEERARQLEEKAEAIRRITEGARRMAEPMCPREEELRRTAEGLRRSAEAMAPSPGELQQLMDGARGLRAAPGDEKSAAATADQLRRTVDAVKPGEEAIRRLGKLAEGMATAAQPKLDEIRRVAPQVRKMAESSVGRGYGRGMEGLHGDAQKMVDGIMSQVQPMPKEVGPITENAKRLREEMPQLNERARSSSD